MRVLPFITIVAISLSLIVGCSDSDDQQSVQSVAQRPAQRQPLSEPPQAVSDESSGSSTFVARVQPSTALRPVLPIRQADADRYDRLDYLTIDEGPYGFRTILGIFSSTDHIDYDMIGLELVCDTDFRGGMLWVYAAAFPSHDGGQRDIAADLDYGKGVQASVVFSRSTDSSEIRLHFDTVERHSAQLFDATQFLAIAKGYETALIRLPSGGDYISAAIDLRGAFSTPIQPNLDWCGAY